jgi:hypothetical protein
MRCGDIVGTLVNRLMERGLPLRNYFYAFKLQKLK